VASLQVPCRVFFAAHHRDTRISLISRFLSQSLSHSHTSCALSLSLSVHSAFSSSQETNEHTARVAHNALAHERSVRRQETLARFHWLDGNNNSSNSNNIGGSNNNSSGGSHNGGGSADNVSIELIASSSASASAVGASGNEEESARLHRSASEARTTTTAIQVCAFAWVYLHFHTQIIFGMTAIFTSLIHFLAAIFVVSALYCFQNIQRHAFMCLLVFRLFVYFRFAFFHAICHEMVLAGFMVFYGLHRSLGF
jgi:hypothetical protein